MAVLQKFSLHCKIRNYLKTELRNQFVFGIKNLRIQARLLKSVDLTMDWALKIAGSMEMADRGVHQLKEEQPAPVDFVGAGAKSRKKSNEKELKKKGQSYVKSEAKKTFPSKDSGHSKQIKNNYNSNKIVCFRCGKNHLAPSCSLPRNTKCLECGGFGHIRKVCKKKTQANYVEDIATIERAGEHSKHRAKYTVSLFVERRKDLFKH